MQDKLHCLSSSSEDLPTKGPNGGTSSNAPAEPQTQPAPDCDIPPIPEPRSSKFRQLARCFFHINCQMEWSTGALVAMNLFSPYEKLSKQPQQTWRLRFYEDFVDLIYQTKDKCNSNYEYIKRLQANFIDKSVVITTNSEGFVLYIQMKGNVMELISKTFSPSRFFRTQNLSY